MEGKVMLPILVGVGIYALLTAAVKAADKGVTTYDDIRYKNKVAAHAKKLGLGDGWVHETVCLSADFDDELEEVLQWKISPKVTSSQQRVREMLAAATAPQPIAFEREVVRRPEEKSPISQYREAMDRIIALPGTTPPEQLLAAFQELHKAAQLLKERML